MIDFLIFLFKRESFNFHFELLYLIFWIFKIFYIFLFIKFF